MRWRRGGIRRSAAVVAALAAAAACGERPGEEEGAPGGSGVGRAFASELDVDLREMDRRPSGLYVRDLREGDGREARPGQTVVVHYTGWLPDGTKFDSSRDRGEPLEIPIGMGRVIEGWDQGVPGMREGGRRQLVIPPELGYGSEGAGGVIPPDATLVFDVELLEVR